jgi:hypothetical protein
MVIFTRSDELREAESAGTDLTGARFVEACRSSMPGSTAVFPVAPAGAPQIRMACARRGPCSSEPGRPRSSAQRRCPPARSTYRSVASGARLPRDSHIAGAGRAAQESARSRTPPADHPFVPAGDPQGGVGAPPLRCARPRRDPGRARQMSSSPGPDRDLAGQEATVQGR